MKLGEGVCLNRIYLVDGPHKGEVVPHELAHGPYLRRRAVRGLEVRETLYRHACRIDLLFMSLLLTTIVLWTIAPTKNLSSLR